MYNDLKEGRKDVYLDGEGVAEEVCEASNGCEHGALHELPCLRECVAQVLLFLVLIHAPP